MFTTEATRNTASRVLDYIDAHPEVHDQNVLIYGLDEDRPLDEDVNICGTTMCVAGTAVFLRAVDTHKSINEVLRESIDYDYEEYGDPWYELAGPMLGLETHEEYNWLFDDMSDDSALHKLEGLANGKITNLDRYGNEVDSEGYLV